MMRRSPSLSASLVARLNHLMLNWFGSAGPGAGWCLRILATCATAFLEAPPSGGFSLLALAGYALFLIMVVMLAALILIPLALGGPSRELMLARCRPDVAVNSSPDARAGVEVVTLPPTAASEGIMRHLQSMCAGGGGLGASGWRDPDWSATAPAP